MIHSFSCKNFYSIRDGVAVSFVVNDKAPKNNGYFNTPAGIRVSKVETVIGPNASGKTNILKVIPFLKWLIVDSFNTNPSAQIPVFPFKFHEAQNPTELSVEFELKKDTYVYSFIITTERILSEELIIKNKTSKRVTSKTLFKRDWNPDIKLYTLDGKNFDFPKGFENLLRSNASVIGVALNHPKSKEIAEYWKRIETNVIEAGWIGDQLMPNTGIRLMEILKFYNENESLKMEAEKLLSRFDLGFAAFKYKLETQGNATTIKNIQAIHTINGQQQLLPIQYESSGTKQLFILLKSILLVLGRGGIAILDEFDVNLHPDMLGTLFDLFIQPETNPHNAQLLFSTHSHLVLSKLDKYQIILTEKNDTGATDVWRLDDMQGVRADDNYYSKYITGAYGAVPDIK